jgi:predicted anti-sigma-YlaC factor YlaD
MKHQPFETWIFQDERLAQDQRRELDLHLKSCSQCRTLSQAWQELAGRFASLKLALPAANFGTRWQERLALRRRQRARRHLLATVYATFGGLFALTALLFTQLYPFLQRIALESLRFMGDVASVFAYVKLVFDIFWLLVETAIANTPLLYRITLPLVLVGMAYLWLDSIRRLGILRMRKE